MFTITFFVLSHFSRKITPFVILIVYWIYKWQRENTSTKQTNVLHRQQTNVYVYFL